MRLSILFSLFLFAGCAESGPAAMAVLPHADGGSTVLDVTQSGLVAFLRSGSYRAWPSEAAPHLSAGPHGGNVRTWLNETLRASSAAGNAVHPNGSIAVKELYGDGTTTPSGFAVDVKNEEGEWIFFEAFEPKLEGYYFRGAGNLCSGCHGRGPDFLLTPASAVQ